MERIKYVGTASFPATCVCTNATLVCTTQGPSKACNAYCEIDDVGRARGGARTSRTSRSPLPCGTSSSRSEAILYEAICNDPLRGNQDSFGTSLVSTVSGRGRAHGHSKNGTFVECCTAIDACGRRILESRIASCDRHFSNIAKNIPPKERALLEIMCAKPKHE